MMHPPTVVGLGEILWDLLPSGRQLGGAPANFAYCSHLLGDRAIVASRVGRDQLGQDIRESLSRAGIADQYLQSDSSQPTGTVQVQLDPGGQPKFQITEPAAWDFRCRISGTVIFAPGIVEVKLMLASGAAP